MISYQEAKDTLQDMSLFFIHHNNKEIHGKFCNARIDKKTIPDGLYAYDFREGEEDDFLASLEPFVLVNHGGTFICDYIIPFGPDNLLNLLNYNEDNYETADLDYSFY